MLKRYKEIFFGGALGILMWIVDAMMHTHIGEPFGASHLLDEIMNPGVSQVFFRSVFVVISTGFGWALWRANLRGRDLETFENAIVAFHHRIDGPALRLANHARLLGRQPSVQADLNAARLVETIVTDAQAIDDLARRYLHVSELVATGHQAEAVESLRAIEI